MEEQERRIKLEVGINDLYTRMKELIRDGKGSNEEYKGLECSLQYLVGQSKTLGYVTRFHNGLVSLRKDFK